MNRPESMIATPRVRPIGRTVVAFVLLVITALAMASCIRDEDLTLEQRQHQLEQELMCPVCDGQTLDQSQAQISRDMKSVIAEKLQAGETNSQIKNYFVARYGEEVLAAPTTGGLNLLAWLMPVVIAVTGGLIVFFALRGMRRTTPPQRSAEDRSLEPYLKQVDEELGLDAAAPKSGSGEESTRG